MAAGKGKSNASLSKSKGSKASPDKKDSKKSKNSGKASVSKKKESLKMDKKSKQPASNLKLTQRLSEPVRPIIKSGEGSRSEDQKLKLLRKPNIKDHENIVANLYPCPICLRNFSPNNLKVHQAECRAPKKEKVVNPLVDRWRRTSLEPYIDKLCHLPSPPRLYNLDWQTDRINMYQEVGITDFEDRESLKEDPIGQVVSEAVTPLTVEEN